MAANPARRPARRTSRGTSQRGRDRGPWSAAKPASVTSAPINTPGARDRPANDLISTNRSQSEERAPQHRAENRGGQAAVAAQCSAPWADRGDGDRRLGGQRRLPRVRGGGDRGLRCADRGRARARAAAWPLCFGGCGGSFRSRPICSGSSRTSSANVAPRFAVAAGRENPASSTDRHLLSSIRSGGGADGEDAYIALRLAHVGPRLDLLLSSPEQR